MSENNEYTAISSVETSGGVARFKFTPDSSLEFDDHVHIRGFITYTSYNGIFKPTSYGSGYFEVSSVPFVGTETAEFVEVSIGYIITDINTAVSSNPLIRPTWFQSIAYDNHGSVITEEIEALSPGASTFNLPVTSPDRTSIGYIAGSYKEVFYDRILIEPVYIDFGSVLSVQQQDILVFNAYLSNRTESNITLNDFDNNTTFIGDTTPSVYLPLEERTHSIIIDPDGPPNIEASIDYDWQGTSDDITVDFIGTRIVLLRITYRAGVKENLLWLNNVMESRNGTEQRVRHRDAPRQQFAVQAYLNKDDRNLIENIMYGTRGTTFAIPVWTESRDGDPITSGDTVINVSTLYGDFRLDGLALIWESSRKFHAFQIDAITDTTITTDRGVPTDFDNPVIMPIRTARFLNDPTRNTTGYDGVFTGAFEVTDNIKLATSASAVQYNGEDFYDDIPLMSNMNGLPDKYNTRVDLLDYKTGVIELVAPWNYNRVNRQFELILDGLEEIWNFRLWLHRRAGRLVPFYMPTFENNLTIIDRGILTDALTCRNDEYSGQSSSRDNMAFRRSDDTWYFRNVLSSAVNSLNQDAIVLDSALGFDYTELEFSSYMGLKRLASDKIEITWLSNNVALVSLSITEISA
jgi:hypothetical protein